MGWQFAILFACSVEKGAAGRPANNRRDRDDSEKCSAREFADKANTSTDRVLRYLNAWNEAAEKGVVQDAATLAPADAHYLKWDSGP